MTSFKFKTKQPNGIPSAFPELAGATQKMTQVHSLGVGSFTKTGLVYRILSLEFLLQAQIIHCLTALESINVLLPLVKMDSVASSKAKKSKDFQFMESLFNQLAKMSEYQETKQLHISRLLRQKGSSPDFAVDSLKLSKQLEICEATFSSREKEPDEFIVSLIILGDVLTELMGEWHLSTPVLFRIIDLLNDALKEVGNESSENPADDIQTFIDDPTSKPTITS